MQRLVPLDEVVMCRFSLTQGTPTYTAPEVELEGRLSKPADVYG